MNKPDHTFTRLFHLCHALRTAGLRDGIDFACTVKHGQLHVMCSQEASDKVKAAMVSLDTRPASVHIYGAPECPAVIETLDILPESLEEVAESLEELLAMGHDDVAPALGILNRILTEGY